MNLVRRRQQRRRRKAGMRDQPKPSQGRGEGPTTPQSLKGFAPSKFMQIQHSFNITMMPITFELRNLSLSLSWNKVLQRAGPCLMKGTGPTEARWTIPSPQTLAPKKARRGPQTHVSLWAGEQALQLRSSSLPRREGPLSCLPALALGAAGLNPFSSAGSR